MPSVNQRRPAYLVAAAMLLAPVFAQAGHGVAKPAPPRALTTGQELGSSVGVDVSSSTFDMDFSSGSFWTVAATGDIWFRGVGFRLQVPAHTLMDNDTRTTGVGDVTVGARTTRNLRRGMRAELALDVALPTGDEDRGLGMGVFGIIPGVQFAQDLPRGTELLAVLSASVATGDGATRAYVGQRSDLEVHGGVGGAWSRGIVRIAGLIGVTRVLSPEMSAGTTLVTLTPSIAAEVTPGLWLRTFAELPLSTQRRLDWQAGLGVAYNWDRAVDPETKPHTHGPDGDVHMH